MGVTPVGPTGGAALSSPAERRAEWRFHGAVTLALATLAVAVRSVSWQRNAALMNDGPTFLALAQKFSEGHWSEALGHAFHPLYPLAIAAARPGFDTWESAAVAVSIVSGGIAVGFLYDFLRHAFPRWAALVGAALLAVHPYAVPFSADVESEGLYMALYLGAVAFAWRTIASPRLATAAAAGLFSGLAYLTRPEGLGVALVALGVLAAQGVRGTRPIRAIAVAGCGMALAVGLVAAPYMASLDHEAGGVRLTRKKSVRAIATLAARQVIGSDPPAAAAAGPEPRAGAPSRGDPGPPRAGFSLRPVARGLVAVADAGRHAFRPDHWILAALGVASLGGTPGLRAVFLAGLVGLQGFVLLGLQLSSGYVSRRHALPPLLPLLGYVALGVPVFGGLLLVLPRRLLGRAPPSRRVVLAVGLVLVAGASTTMAVRPQRVGRAATRAAAEWLAAQGGAERVAATKQRDAYYARARYARLPEPRNGRGVDWVEALRRRGVRFAIVDERMAKRYPELAPAPAGSAPDARLRIVHRAEARGRTAVVVEILGVE